MISEDRGRVSEVVGGRIEDGTREETVGGGYGTGDWMADNDAGKIIGRRS